MHRMSCLIEHNVYRLRAYVPFHSEIKSENTNMWRAGNANPRWSSPEQAMIAQDWTHNVGYFLSHWCKYFNHIKAWIFLCYARDIPNTYIDLSGTILFSVWQNQWQNRLQLSFQRLNLRVRRVTTYHRNTLWNMVMSCTGKTIYGYQKLFLQFAPYLALSKESQSNGNYLYP
jgi:hypothetical protein